VTALRAALLLVTLATAAAAGEGGVDPPRPLRIVTYNLLHGGVLSGWAGHGQDLDRRLELAAAELSVLRPDVIGLQEASVGRGRGNVAERLADRLGYHWVHARASFRVFEARWLNRLIAAVMNFTEGPAILSRFPIVASETLDLRRCGRFMEVRVALYAELETPWGRLPVVSTHTSGNPCQTRHVAELVRARRGWLPAVVMGDFNAPESSPAIAVLTEDAAFTDAFRTANPAAPGMTVWQQVYSAGPTVRRRVDYVFLAPGTEVAGRVLGSRVVLDRPGQLPDGRVLWPSDHYGVLAEVEVFAPTMRAGRVGAR